MMNLGAISMAALVLRSVVARISANRIRNFLNQAAALIAALLVFACGGDDSVSRQVAQPPPSLTTNHVLSGIVMEASAGPVAGASVNVWVEQAFSGFHFGTIETDGQGRYKVSDLPDGFVLLYASKNGYSQPCAATATVSADTVLDIELVSDSTSQPPSKIASPTLSGVVFETTREGKRPVAGAGVAMEWFPDLPTARTKSDSAGRYLLCSLPTGPIGIWVSKPGYQATNVGVRFHGDTVFDIEIKRQ